MKVTLSWTLKAFVSGSQEMIEESTSSSSSCKRWGNCTLEDGGASLGALLASLVVVGVVVPFSAMVSFLYGTVSWVCLKPEEVLVVAVVVEYCQNDR